MVVFVLCSDRITSCIEDPDFPHTWIYSTENIRWYDYYTVCWKPGEEDTNCTA